MGSCNENTLVSYDMKFLFIFGNHYFQDGGLGHLVNETLKDLLPWTQEMQIIVVLVSQTHVSGLGVC